MSDTQALYVSNALPVSCISFQISWITSNHVDNNHFDNTCSLILLSLKKKPKKKLSPCVIRFHCFSQGLTVFYKFWVDFFPKTQFSKKTNKGSSIYSMINKNKTSSRDSLSLSWALLLIVLVKTHIDNSPSELLKKVKKSATEYNHVEVLRLFSIQ